MWPRTDLIELLGIDHPIVQAPMAGPDSPTLAAALVDAFVADAREILALKP